MFWGRTIESFTFEAEKKDACMFQSFISHVSLPWNTQQSLKDPVWIFHKPCLCFLFMSCLNTLRPIASRLNQVNLLDVRRVREQRQHTAARRGRRECSSSLQKAHINQTNYRATTVLNPWKGNEMIRGRSLLNREWVNENINYLMIYWKRPTLSHSLPLLKAPTAESICFNWVVIRLLHLAESLDYSL